MTYMYVNPSYLHFVCNDDARKENLQFNNWSKCLSDFPFFLPSVLFKGNKNNKIFVHISSNQHTCSVSSNGLWKYSPAIFVPTSFLIFPDFHLHLMEYILFIVWQTYKIESVFRINVCTTQRHSSLWRNMYCRDYLQVGIQAKWLIRPDLIPASMAWSNYFYSSLDGMLARLPPALNLLLPIYTPGWREALWGLGFLPKNTTQLSPARARAPTTQSKDQDTNHEATTPPCVQVNVLVKSTAFTFKAQWEPAKISEIYGCHLLMGCFCRSSFMNDKKSHRSILHQQ